VFDGDSLVRGIGFDDNTGGGVKLLVRLRARGEGEERENQKVKRT